jgi:putative transposase
VNQTRYRKTAGCVYNLHFHVVWCPKYRKKVLVGDVAQALDETLRVKAADLGIEIEALEVMPDHVHLFIATPPTDAPQYFVNQFKGYTSRLLRQQFPHLVRLLPTLWSRSYYVGSAGQVSAETIQAYIAAQKTRS